MSSCVDADHYSYILVLDMSQMNTPPPQIMLKLHLINPTKDCYSIKNQSAGFANSFHTQLLTPTVNQAVSSMIVVTTFQNQHICSVHFQRPSNGCY